MRLGTPTLSEGPGNQVRLAAAVDDGTLWFAVDRDYADYLDPSRSDPFVVAALLRAMRTGEPIVAAGTMSERLYFNLTHYYQPVVIQAIPSLQQSTIEPAHLTSNVIAGRSGVATGLSGGIDSFCTLADFLVDSAPPSFALTHLTFHDVGSHGSGGDALRDERYNRMRPLADELNLPFIKVRSNLDDFLQMDFQLTASLRNLATALLFQRVFLRYIYASTFRYSDCYVGPTYDLSYADPLAVHLLSTENTDLMSSGSQYSRVDKTRRVAELPLSYRFLDVCVNARSRGNCSKCFKCLRTMLTLEMLGKLHHYQGIFDLEQYGDRRNRYIASVLASDDVFAREIREHAARVGYSFPARCRARAFLRRLVPSTSSRWRHLPTTASRRFSRSG